MSFRAFSRNEKVFATVCRKVHRNVKTLYFVRKVASFDQIHDFSSFFTKWTTFSNLFLKSSSKCKNMVVFLEKLHSVGQIDDFSCFFTKWSTFCNFFLKSSWKCQDMVVCSKSCKFLPNRWFFVAFCEMRHLLQFFLKSWSKCKDMVVCSKSCKVLAKSTIFCAFSRIEALSATFCWKVNRKTKTW